MSFTLPRPSRRIILLGLWIVILGGFFWAGSRYPTLNAKAFMGGETMLEDPLSFEALIELQASDSVPLNIIYTTINWVHTNLRGMAFGLLIGAAFLSGIQLLHRRAFSSGLGNTLLGMAMGAPLGVCVNCAAPVAKGIHDGGARLETTLAAMVSSPTLNIVVLTMTFSILPTYLAVTKLAFTLIFILLVIPLLSRTVFRAELAQTIENATCDIDVVLPGDANESWFHALRAVVVDYVSSLWFIVRKTVPLMLLAGLLGAAMATLVPIESLTNLGSGLLSAVLVAAVGLFLPVPMAFDVILSAVLLGAGLPIFYVMVLLFVLGIFSCYSAFIVATTISRQVALVLSGLLVVMGLLAGLTADALHRSELHEMLARAGEGATRATRSHGEAPVGAPPNLPSTEKRTGDADDSAAFQVSIERTDHLPRSPTGEKLFTRSDGDALGIAAPMDFSVEDFWPPFYNGRGLSSADFDNDGWMDLVVATETGPRLYRNEQGRRFSLQPIRMPDLAELNVFVVAPVDLNDDGWPDLLLTTYRHGTYFLLNEAGHFDGTPLYRMPTPGDPVISHAVSFGDVDLDGDLDAVFGNWFYGSMRGGQPLPGNAQNFLFRNLAGTFTPEPLHGIIGETLSILLSDWTGDGMLDLIQGNDFDPPDIYSIGSEDGSFRELFRQDGLIQISTAATMSIDTADIDNDLSLEIYMTNIAMRPSDVDHASMGERQMGDYCQDIEDATVRGACQANMLIRNGYEFGGAHQPSHIAKCDEIDDDDERRDCQGMTFMKTALRERDASLCDSIPKSHDRGRFLCEIFFFDGIKVPDSVYTRAIPQTRGRNVLLKKENDRWRTQANQRNIEATGWSWHGKFADLDNDEWKDLYVVNGTWLKPAKSPSNAYFRNRGGVDFELASARHGLDDYLIVSAYTYIDIDNDGDLDIVTNSVNGPFRVYRNNETDNHAITIDLRDHLGNRFGIGSKITIFYAGDGVGEGDDENESRPDAVRHQIIELKSGGGFLSHDAPVAHFGLGGYEEIERIEVHWSTGETTTHEGPFPVDAHYRIERRDAAEAPPHDSLVARPSSLQEGLEGLALGADADR